MIQQSGILLESQNRLYMELTKHPCMLEEKINRFKTRSEILYSQGGEEDNSNIFYCTCTLSECNQSLYVVDTTSTGLVYFLHLLCNLFCCYHNWLHKNYERSSLFQYPVKAMCSRIS